MMFKALRYLRWIVIFLFIILCLVTIDNTAAERWEVVSEIPTGRMDFATAVVDGKVYLIGGTRFENRDGPFGMSLVEVYDPETNSWDRAADMPTSRSKAKAVAVDGKIYVLSGVNAVDRLIVNNIPVKVVEVYNPLTDTWTRKQDMPTARKQFGIGAVDGKIYVIGGANFLEDPWRFNLVESYNFQTDTWMKRAKMPTIRDGVGTGVVNGNIYVFGGGGWPAGPIGGPRLQTIEVYHPKINRWKKMPDMPNLRISFSTVVVQDNIYLIGGFVWQNRTPQYLASVDVYNPETDEWNNIPPMPTPFIPIGAAVVNGNIYVFGGKGENRENFTSVVVFGTGFHPVTARGKLTTRWGKLKTQHKN